MPDFCTVIRLFGLKAVRRSAVVLLFAVILQAHAQDPPRREIDVNEFVQALFPVPSEDVDYSDQYEALFQLYTNPLNLNTASSDELAATFILSEIQIKSFLDYRQRLRPLLSLYELQAVPNFDLETINRLLPFVTVQGQLPSLRGSFGNPTQHFLMVRSGRILEPQKGFAKIDTNSRSTSRYQGKPLYGYLRYRYARAGVFSFGLSMEKDAGEQWLNWNLKRQISGADFTSFHAQILNRGKLKNLIIGDFQMQAGQGLVFSAGFSLGKGTEVIRTTYRSTLGVKPYTSVLESGFFRGAAATYSIAKQWDMTGFYAANRRDASFDVADSGELLVSSVLVSGYHRTPTELEKHGIISERNAGLHFLHRLQSQRGQIGATLLHTGYGSSLQKKDVPYNLFEFSGKTNLIVGLHGDYRWQNVHIFGEAARSASGGLGGVGGFIVGLGKNLDLTMLFRHYDRNFHSLYGNAIGEATRPINESGVYWGLRYSPSRRWQFSAFYDYFRFSWLKFQIDAPSDGQDYLLHALWKRNKKFSIYGMFHEKQKAHNLPGGLLPIIPVTNTVRHTATANMEYDVPLRYAVRTRIQYGSYRYNGGTTSSGFTVVQDFTWRLKKMEISSRVAFFKTDNYDSRQYVYEKDVLYAFSIPAYYDTGTRHYLMLRYNLSEKIKLWLRWSQTRYTQLDKISSGLNEIQGNKRSELKIQLMYQL
jgi:hypothetical protein